MTKDEFKGFEGKRVKLFVKNLNERPIVYSAAILSVGDNFIFFIDRIGDRLMVNKADIIQIRAEDDRGEYG